MIEIDEGMYQLVADDQVIGETEKNNICDALESIKSQKVKLDFLRSSVNYSFYGTTPFMLDDLMFEPLIRFKTS